jgi:hypothetical protein
MTTKQLDDIKRLLAEATPSKTELKALLFKATRCRMQHTGWPCGTCFFAMQKRKGQLTNKHWQAVLFYRGDYKREDLDNLPKDIPAAIRRVAAIAATEVQP